MSGLRFESMADMPPRMRELYAKQAAGTAGAQQTAKSAAKTQQKYKSYRFGGKLVVEDVKSKPTRTKEYLRNKKMMRSKYGIDIQEV